MIIQKEATNTRQGNLGWSHLSRELEMGCKLFTYLGIAQLFLVGRGNVAAHKFIYLLTLCLVWVILFFCALQQDFFV